ncbi:MAG TPA: TonB-dependent receptor [Ohtaekwangia sp.]|nr:TonB-dependent receptor [Ohtaekwangia sp.]
MIKQFAVVLIVLLGSLSAICQSRNVLIKGEFYNMPLRDFLRQVEKQHGVRFHYLEEVVKGATVSGILKYNTTLHQALEILLKPLPISFTENDQGEIVLFSNPNKPVPRVEKYGKVTGTIRDKATGNPLPFVTVHLPALSKGVISDEAGKFAISPVPYGTLLIQFSFVGYQTEMRKIDVVDVTNVDVVLEENAMQLKELIITPSMFEIATVEVAPLTLGKEEILHSPNMGKDIYRTLRALPGIANNDFSAKARIRGGHSDESAVYLDHLLINEPFHLEEVDGSFSIFNTDYVDELTVLTGGFSAQFTDRLSGVIDVKTSDDLESDRYRLSIDLLNASFIGQKKLREKTNVFLTARRGYLDFLLSDMGSDDTDALKPRFSDVWTKVTHVVNSQNRLSFNFLMGRDNFYVKDVDDFAAQLDLKNIRNNINAWANWKWFPSKRVNAITTLGYQVLTKEADFVFDENLAYDNFDDNSTSTIGLTNNTFWDINAQHSIAAGFEVKWFHGTYDYKESRYDVFHSDPDHIIINEIDLHNKINGVTSSAYVQYNARFSERFIVQPGIRLSHQTFSPELKVAPRIALSYTVVPAVTARASYGKYFQPDLYYKLRSSLQQTRPIDTNSEAVHYTGSVTFHHGKTDIITNVYYKDYRKLLDDYRFEFFNRVGGVNILDVPFNTTSGFSKGVEIMIRQQYGKQNMLSFSYAYAKSRIRSATGVETFRDFDQPHTFILNNMFRLPRHWNISLLGTYHTGYPYTPTRVDFSIERSNQEGVIIFYEAGLKNDKRLPDFHSLDVRIEKSWHFKKSMLTAYLNIVNFYNRSNVRSYWWSPEQDRNGNMYFIREAQTNIPSFISPGISFTIY